MNYENIADVYEMNDRIRGRLLKVVESLTPDDEKLLTDKKDWDVAMIVEHLAAVEYSMAKISERLLTKAKNDDLKSDGSFKISSNFIKGITELRETGGKFEAPEMVQPKGGKPVAESIVALKAGRDEITGLRSMFEEYDASAFTFTHPGFGEMTATDWLILLGGHESRHTEQIERILSRKNAAKA